MNDLEILIKTLINVGVFTIDDFNNAKDELLNNKTISNNDVNSFINIYKNIKIRSKTKSNVKRFEFPYNFDKEIINYIINNNYSDYIEHIYVAPFKDDYIGAKHYYFNDLHPSIKNNVPSDRNQYEDHIRHIIDSGFTVAILFQNPKHILSNELLTYYLNLGATVFIVNNDETAKMIKSYNKNLQVIASITKKLSFSDFNTKDLSMYDKFVLYFPFNRSLETVKKLPKRYDYIFLLNCGCGYTCPGSFHWFAGKKDDGSEDINPQLCRSGRLKETIYILPTFLDLFDDYAYCYKLQGREYSTDELKLDLDQYISRQLFRHVENIYNEIINNYTIDEFFNVANSSNNSYLK